MKDTNVRYYCTYFDQRYLARGFALYQSLQNCSREPFRLLALCFDEVAHEIVARFAGDDLRPIKIGKLEAHDPAFAACRENRSLVEYYWTATPCLPLFIFQRHADVDLLTYLDADTLCLSDPSALFAEFGESSLGIVEHSFTPGLEYLEKFGRFNVGVMLFRRDDRAIDALSWWRERCIEYCGTELDGDRYGDQKYLDQWPGRFPGVVILKNLGIGLAPWNLDGQCINVKSSPLRVAGEAVVFYHFHGLKLIHPLACQPSHQTYKLRLGRFLKIYQDYVGKLRKCEQQLGLEPATEAGAVSWINLWGGLFRQGWLLTRWPVIARLLWWFSRRSVASRQELGSSYAAFRDGRITEARAMLLPLLRRHPFALLQPWALACTVSRWLGLAWFERKVLERSATHPPREPMQTGKENQ